MKATRFLALAVPALLAAAAARAGSEPPGKAPEACGCCVSPAEAAGSDATGAGAAPDGRSVYAQRSPWETDAGGTFELSGLRGRTAVVALFYTSCHVACPATLRELADVERRLPKSSSVAIVLVTIDPATDTPARLAACRAEWRLPERVLMLRGSEGATRRFADSAGIVFRQETARLVHVPKIVVLDPQGRVAASFPGSRSDPADVAGAALRADAPAAAAGAGARGQ
jgi:protein SCO1/2